MVMAAGSSFTTGAFDILMGPGESGLNLGQIGRGEWSVDTSSPSMAPPSHRNRVYSSLSKPSGTISGATSLESLQ